MRTVFFAAMAGLYGGARGRCALRASFPLGVSTKEADSLAEGSLVHGRFRILRRLGEGAFGPSYLAEEPSTGRRVVLKVASAADEDGSLGRRLVAEGKVLSRVAGPRIARLLDVGTLENGRPYLVLEWTEGLTLREVLDGGALSPAQALDVLGALSEAVASVHAAGVIHRDLKPTNVVLPAGPRGPRFEEATLIDFGAFGELVRRTRWESSKAQTVAGEFYGTPYYMAPEQIAAAPQTAATDIYGLGLLLFEMLFGRPPFHGEPLVSFLGKRLKGEIPLPAEPPLPGDVRSLLSDLLRGDPAARPQSAAEVRSRVEKIRGRLRVGGMVGEITGAVQIPASPSATPPLSPASPAGPPPTAPAKASSPPSAKPSPATTTAEAAAPRGARTRRMGFFWALAAVALVVTIFILLGQISRRAGTGHDESRPVAGVLLGLLLIAAGAAIGVSLSRFLRRRGGEIQREAGRLLLGAKSRDILTSTLQLQIEELIARCRRVDERILGITIAQMVGEFQGAASSNERQAALMNAAQLLEKLMSRLSPWYVRHEKALAFAVSLVGVLTGVASLVASVLKLLGAK